LLGHYFIDRTIVVRRICLGQELFETKKKKKLGLKNAGLTNEPEPELNVKSEPDTDPNKIIMDP
jgi:hypothetical protein